MAMTEQEKEQRSQIQHEGAKMLVLHHGLTYADARLVIDLAQKAADDSFALIKRITELAPPHIAFHVAMASSVGIQKVQRQLIAEGQRMESMSPAELVAEWLADLEKGNG